MAVDALLTPFRTQLVHSKITVIRTSLPLAMNLLWIFFYLLIMKDFIAIKKMIVNKIIIETIFRIVVQYFI